MATQLYDLTDIGVNELIAESYDYSKSNGFHDDPTTTFGDRIALIHSELSEVLEEYRNGNGFNEIYYKEVVLDDGTVAQVDKPEGIPIEFADTIIRIADACGVYGIDLVEAIRIKQQFNRTRPYRHGKKAL